MTISSNNGSIWIGTAFLVGSLIYVLRGENTTCTNQVSKRAPKGLVNYGNTCFFNVILQALSTFDHLMLDSLRFSLKAFEKLVPVNSNDHQFTVAFVDFISQLRDTSSHLSYLHPRYLLRLLSSSSLLSTLQQQDCHELLHLIFHIVSNINEPGISQPGIANLATESFLSHRNIQRQTVFNGDHLWRSWVSSEIRCEICKVTRPSSTEVYDSFSLCLSHAGKMSIDSCFSNFFAPNVVDNVVCSNCSNKPPSVVHNNQQTLLSIESVDVKSHLTELRSRHVRNLKLVKAPKILCLHLQRTALDGSKSTCAIQFQETLIVNELSPVMYRLNAVVVHFGKRVNNGHFVVYIRQHLNRWFFISDIHVEETTFAKVSSCLYPYMLFYEKI